jgi:phosphonate transport system substrate-binding protein
MNQRLVIRSVPSRFLALLLFLIAALALAGCDDDSNEAGANPEELVISFTPEADPIHLELDAEGLASFLSQELDIPVRAEVDADYAATVEAMAAGHAHIATNLAPLQAAAAMERAGAKLILAEERDGRAYYHSRFWVLKDSGIESLEDLRGTSVAFNDPLSGSGYLMPVAILIDHGLVENGDELEDFFDNVYFAGGTELSINALINGHVDAAGVSENAAEVFLSPEDRELVTYIAESDPMPRHAIAVSGDLSDDLVEQITEAFLKLNEPEHNEILEGLYGWTKVVAADEDLYPPLLEMAQAAGLIDDIGSGR